MHDIKNETLELILSDVMKIEKKYAFEKTGVKTSKIEELTKLIDTFCEKEVDNEN